MAATNNKAVSYVKSEGKKYGYNSISNWTRNALKSIGYSAIKSIGETNPVVKSIYSDNVNTVKEMYQNIRDFSKDIKSNTKSNSIVTEYTSIAHEGLRNVIEDLKSGKFYNKERAERVEMEVMGMDDMFADFGDFGDFGDFDDDVMSSSKDDGLDNNTAAIVASDRQSDAALSASMDNVGAKISNAVGHATAKSAQYIVAATDAAAKGIMSRQQQIFNQMSTGFLSVKGSLSTIEQIVEPLHTHMQNASVFYTKTTEQNEKIISLLESINKNTAPISASQSSSYKSYKKNDQWLTTDGAIDIGSLLDTGKSNFKKAIENNPMLGFLTLLTDSAHMMGVSGAKGNAYRTWISSPISTLLTLSFSTLQSKSFKKESEKFNKAISDFNTMLVSSINKLKKSDNFIAQFIGDLLGYDIKYSQKMDTSKYQKGKVDFDGKTRKAIIEVIPTYLSKILKAITGGFETRYDYDKGKFVRIKDLKKQLDEEVSNSAYFTTSDMRSYARNEYQGSDKYKNLDMEDIISRYVQYQIRNIEKSPEVLNGGKLPKNINARKYGLKNADEVKALNEFFATLKTSNPSLYYGLNPAIERSATRIAERWANESADSVYTALNNNSNGGTFGNDRAIGGSGKANNKAVYEANKKQYEAVYGKNKAYVSSISDVKEFERQCEQLVSDGMEAKEVEAFRKEYERIYINGKEGNDSARKQFAEKFSRAQTRQRRKNSGNVSSFERGLDDAKGKIGKMLETVQNAVSAPFDAVAKILHKGTQTLYDIMYGVDDGTGKPKDIMSAMIKKTEEVFDEFKKHVTEKMTKVGDAIAKFLFGKDATLDDVKSWMKDKTRDLFSGVKDTFKEWFGMAKDNVSENYREAKGFVNREIKRRQAHRKLSKEEQDALKERKKAERWERQQAKARKAAQQEARDIANMDEYEYQEHLAEQGSFDAEDIGAILSGEGSRLRRFRGGRSKKKKRGQNFFRQGKNVHEKLDNMAKSAKSGVKKVGQFFSENGFIRDTYEQIHNATVAFADAISPGDKEGKSKKEKQFRSTMKEAFKAFKLDPSGGIAGSLLGGGLSLFSGGLISPLLGAAIGGGLGIVAKSEAVQNALFGEIEVTRDEKTGKVTKERNGGLLGKKISNFLTKDLKKAVPGILGGGLGGLLLHGFPGGPIGGMLVGAGVNFAVRSKGVQEFFFGSEKDNTYGILGNSQDRAKMMEKIKNMLPKAAAGAIGGAAVGAFTSFGFAPAVVLGTMTGLVSDTQKFKDTFFGTEVDEVDENGKKTGRKIRQGGVMGYVRDKILDPVKQAISPIAVEIKTKAKDIVGTIATGIRDAARSVLEGLKVPLLHKLTDYLLKPLGKAGTRLLSPVKNIIAAPFQAIGKIGKNLRKKQIRQGYASDMTAAERLRYRRVNGMGTDEYTMMDQALMGMSDEEMEEFMGEYKNVQSNRNKSANAQFNAKQKFYGSLRKAGANVKDEKAVQRIMEEAGSKDELFSLLKERGIELDDVTRSKITKEYLSFKKSMKETDKNKSNIDAFYEKYRKKLGLSEIDDKSVSHISDLMKREMEARKKGEAKQEKTDPVVVQTKLIEAKADLFDARLVDIINLLKGALYKEENLPPTPGGSAELAKKIANEANAENKKGTEFTEMGEDENGKKKDTIKDTNTFQKKGFIRGLIRTWNPLYDMNQKDVTKMLSAYDKYESLKARGKLEEFDLDGEEGELKSHVVQIKEGNPDLVEVTDYSGKKVILRRVGGVWMYAASQYIGKALKRKFGGVITAGKIIGDSIRRAFNPYAGMSEKDIQEVKQALHEYELLESGKGGNPEFATKVSTPFFNKKIVCVEYGNQGRTIYLKKVLGSWVAPTRLDLMVNASAKNAVKKIGSVIKGVGDAGKKIIDYAKHKMNPYCDLKDQDAAEKWLKAYMQGNNTNGNVVEVPGTNGKIIQLYDGTGRSTYLKRTNSGNWVWASDSDISAAKNQFFGLKGIAKRGIGAIGAIARSLFRGKKKKVQQEEAANTEAAPEETQAAAGGNSRARRMYGGGSFLDGVKTLWNGLKTAASTAKKVAKGAAGIGAGIGLLSLLNSSSDDEGQDKENKEKSNSLLDRINKKITDIRKPTADSEDDSSKGLTKEERVQQRKDEARFGVFRANTANTSAISEKMDIIINSLGGASSSKSGGLLGGLAKLFKKLIGPAILALGALLMKSIWSGGMDSAAEEAGIGVDNDNKEVGSNEASSITGVTEDGKVESAATDANGNPIRDEDGNVLSTSGNILVAGSLSSNGTKGAGRKAREQIARGLITGKGNIFSGIWKGATNLASKMPGGKLIQNTVGKLNTKVTDVIAGGRNKLLLNIGNKLGIQQAAERLPGIGKYFAEGAESGGFANWAADQVTQSNIVKQGKEAIEKFFKKGVKEAAEEGAEGVAKGGVKAVGDVMEGTFKSLTKEGAEGVSKGAIKAAVTKIREAIVAFFKRLAKNGLAKSAINNVADCGPAIAKEVAEEFEKQAGKAGAKAAGEAVEGATKCVPVVGWIITAVFFIADFEEGWNSAERTFNVKEPTNLERFVSGVVPALFGLIPFIGGLIPSKMLINLVIKGLEMVGVDFKGLRKRQDEANKELEAFNAKREEMGLEKVSYEQYATMDASEGGLDKRTWGEHITGAFKTGWQNTKDWWNTRKDENGKSRGLIDWHKTWRANKKAAKEAREKSEQEWAQWHADYEASLSGEGSGIRRFRGRGPAKAASLNSKFKQVNPNILKTILNVKANGVDNPIAPLLKGWQNATLTGNFFNDVPALLSSVVEEISIINDNLLTLANDQLLTNEILTDGKTAEEYDKIDKAKKEIDEKVDKETGDEPETLNKKAKSSTTTISSKAKSVSDSANSHDANLATKRATKKIDKAKRIASGGDSKIKHLPEDDDVTETTTTETTEETTSGKKKDSKDNSSKKNSEFNKLLNSAKEKVKNLKRNKKVAAKKIQAKNNRISSRFLSGSLFRLFGGGSFVSQVGNHAKFGPSNIDDNGCAPAVMSMITGRSLDDTAKYALQGGYVNGQGTAADFFDSVANEYIYTGKGSGMSPIDEIASNIESGHPTVLLGRDASNTSKAYSPFGPGDHYVLATGTTSNGGIVVQDPEASRPNMVYDKSILNSVRLGIPTGGNSMLRGGDSGADDGSREATIWKFLKSQGMSDGGAAGVMGNWQVESQNNPDTVEGNYLSYYPGADSVLASNASLNEWTQKLFNAYAKSGNSINQKGYLGEDGNYYPGFGLAQWTGPRGYNLLKYAEDKGANWRDLGVQLDFFKSEYDKKDTLKELMNTAPDSTKGTEDFFDYFEACKPGAHKTVWAYAERKEHAKDFFDKFGGLTGSPGDITSYLNPTPTAPQATGSIADYIPAKEKSTPGQVEVPEKAKSTPGQVAMPTSETVTNATAKSNNIGDITTYLPGGENDPTTVAAQANKPMKDIKTFLPGGENDPTTIANQAKKPNKDIKTFLPGGDNDPNRTSVIPYSPPYKTAGKTADKSGEAGGKGEAPSSIPEQVWAYFTNNGYSEAGAAGILGNMKSESGVYPRRVQGDFNGSPETGYPYSDQYTEDVDKGTISKDAFVSHGPHGNGYGIVQFTYKPYKEQLYNAAKDAGSSIGDLDTQLRMVSTQAAGALGHLKDATEPEDAASIFLREYEKPRDIAGTEPTRQRQAREYYNMFKGKKFTYEGSSGEGGKDGKGKDGKDKNGNILGTFVELLQKAFAKAWGPVGKLLGFSSGEDDETEGKDKNNKDSKNTDEEDAEQSGTDTSSLKNAGDIARVGTPYTPSYSSSSTSLGTGKKKETSAPVLDIKAGTPIEKQNALVQLMQSIAGTIDYSMSGPRDPDQGSADCSSTVSWAYKKVLGHPVGSYTEAMLNDKHLVTIDQSDLPESGGTGSGPNYDKLMPGDVVLFSRPTSDFTAGRKYRVGHVEMYVGNGKTIGHGSGKGPKEKELDSARYIMARRDKDIVAQMEEEQKNIDIEGTKNNAKNIGTPYTPPYGGKGSGLKPILARTFYGGNSEMPTMSGVTEPQLALVKLMQSIAGTLDYSMSGPRNPDQGSADCSSTVSWAYNRILGHRVGGNTLQMLTDPNLVTVDQSNIPESGGTGSGPNYNNLMPGDVLLFSRPNSDFSYGRPYRVGHVEMYVGNGRTIGHGSGKGPKEKDMDAAHYIMARRDKMVFGLPATASADSLMTGMDTSVGSGIDVMNQAAAPAETPKTSQDIVLSGLQNLLAPYTGASTTTTPTSIGSGVNLFNNTPASSASYVPSATSYTSSYTPATNYGSAYSTGGVNPDLISLLNKMIEYMARTATNTDQLNAILKVIENISTYSGSGSGLVGGAFSDQNGGHVLPARSSRTNPFISGSTLGIEPDKSLQEMAILLNMVASGR